MKLSFRTRTSPDDRRIIREILESAENFYPLEVEVAIELLDDRLEFGDDSSFEFLFAAQKNETVAYSCYGPIPLTEGRYDLYWIAVRKKQQANGVGRAILAETERRISLAGGKYVFIETSSRDDYDSTRRFYEACGYRQAAHIPEFYRPGDDKIIFSKKL